MKGINAASVIFFCNQLLSGIMLAPATIDCQPMKACKVSICV